MRYRLSEIATIVGGTLHGEDREVRGVTCDSRSFVAGDDLLFVAMVGVNHDSHEFMEQMLSRGVVSFMVEREIYNNSDRSYIIVQNSIQALQLLAAHHRNNFKGTVIGVTGSNGKTIVKEWTAQTMPQSVKLFRSPRSYNSQLGVALSILMIEGNEDIAIIEAGISQPNEMEHLWRMIRPNIAVITYIGEAHQAGFESTEQKIQEKLILTRETEAIIYHSSCSEITPYILYSSDSNSEQRVIDAAEFQAANFKDRASRNNSQLVSAIAHTLGYEQPNFNSVKSIAMRLEVVEGVHNSTIINDSYNSDINSLAIALDTLQSTAAGGDKVVIISDILQSGVECLELYKNISYAIKCAGVEKLIGVGHEIAKWAKLFSCDTKFYATTDELLRLTSPLEFANKTILIKGNRDSQFEKISHALAYKSHTTTLEVDLNTMRSNLNFYRSKLQQETKLIAMVKANSYGAGNIEVAQLLQHEGVDYLAVAFADEGTLLREKGITMPIIVLNADDGSFAQMVDSRLEPEIYSLRSLRDFAAALEARGERNYPIHIKIDSGMHRLGFMSGEVDDLIAEITKLQGTVRISSIFSHLSSADMGCEGRERTISQIQTFEELSGKICSAFDYPILRHLANSAAIEAYPEAHFDMCRLGIGLYGFGGDNEQQLEPISTLKTRIVQIRTIETPECVGYGAAGKIDQTSRIATIPIGYADGMNRHLGNGAWSVLINGQSAPIIGRICMDSLMVDISTIKGVEEGDEVVIFSAQEGNRASDMAQILGTIVYEVLTSVSERVKRIYLKD